AVFPHTALQLVVSASGLAQLPSGLLVGQDPLPRSVQGQQPPSHGTPLPAPSACALSNSRLLLASICTGFSRCRHFQCCVLPLGFHRASTFLPPFPRAGFATRPSRGSRRSGTMKDSDSCRARPSPAGLPAYSALSS